MLTTCNKLDWTIRLVARLLQQDWYSRDVTTLLQPCRNRYIRVVCNTSDVPVKLVATCTKLADNLEKGVRTSLLQVGKFLRVYVTSWTRH